jgi:hypothetical protein
MKLTQGEYCRFSLKGRVRLLDNYGTVIAERYYSEMQLKVFQFHDFYVEVLYDLINKRIIKAEPVVSKQMLSHYIRD